MTIGQGTLDGQRLKGSVKIGETRPTGSYSSKRFEFSAEFYLDSETHEKVLSELKQKLERAFEQW